MSARGATINIIGLLVAAPVFGYAVAHNAVDIVLQDASSMLAATDVGLSLGVQQNPYNTLAAELNAKAAALEDKERKLEVHDSFATMSLIMSIVLFALVALNFWFDQRRGTRRANPQYAIDLR